MTSVRFKRFDSSVLRYSNLLKQRLNEIKLRLVWTVIALHGYHLFEIDSFNLYFIEPEIQDLIWGVALWCYTMAFAKKKNGRGNAKHHIYESVKKGLDTLLKSFRDDDSCKGTI